MSEAGVVMRPERPPRPVLTATMVALMFTFGGILLLSLPGALLMEVGVPVVELLRGAPQGSLFHGDAAWPMAIILTFVVPPMFPVLLWLWLKLFHRRMGRALLFSLVGLWVWSVLILLLYSRAL